MKYTVFSIDNSRRPYIRKIRHLLAGWDEVETKCVNGSISAELDEYICRHGYEILDGPGWQKKVGELGIWYTVLNSLHHAPVVTFEDDALLGTNFLLNFRMRMKELPDDADFFSLFVPHNQLDRFTEEHQVSRTLARAYTSYGGVSMYYTEQGVEKIRKLLGRDGIRGQYDDTLYRYSAQGELNGYQSLPGITDLVYISGREPTLVHETALYG